MANKTVLVLIPTFSQTIEQRICAGINAVFEHEPVQIIHAPLAYLPEDNADIGKHLWIHAKLSALKPDVVLAYGGGLAYRSTDDIYQQVLDQYAGIPVVNMGFQFRDYTSVLVDNYVGMYELMSIIVARQPEQPILFIAGPKWNHDSKLRLAALEDVLSEQGRSLAQVKVLTGDFTASVAQNLFQQYLDSTPKPARLIVCANDLTAKGVLDCLKGRKLTCPEHFWVTGYDDFEYAASIQPGLSTVHFPARDVGLEAAKIALKMLQQPQASFASTTVKGYPVLRGTTGDTPPGLGDYDKQISEQWALIHQRDNNARKLSVIRSFQSRAPLVELLYNAQLLLADLDIQYFAVYRQFLGPDGFHYLKPIDLTGQVHAAIASEILLPPEFKQPSDGFYWLMCDLTLQGQHYGYLVAKCSSISAEFVEFLAPQISELLNTEDLEAKNENYRIQNELNERMASLGSLVSGVAHEVNTPVGTGKLAASAMLKSLERIRGLMASQTLTKNDFDEFVEESDELASIIFQSLDRAGELIANFKMVSVDQTAEEKRQFDLGDYIHSVLTGLRHQLKGLPIELNCQLAQGVMVEAFPGAVAQVITNLFMNAVKHGFDEGQQSGEINIRLTATLTGFLFEVADNGQGATQEVLNHIFDPFFTTSRGRGGSGLGMHIVYNLLTQKLNWGVHIESTPGQGFLIQMQPA